MKGGDMMDIGISKKFDELGRITVPKEYRDFYHFNTNEKVQLIATPKGLLIMNQQYEVIKKKSDS